MPKIMNIRLKIKDPRKLTDAFLEAIAEGVSEYIQKIYPLIILYAPKEKTSKDPRRTPGIIAKNLKMIDAELMGKHYFAIGIPGSEIKDSEQYRAMMATLAFHYGWAGPLTIHGKPVMTFPVGAFRKGTKGRPPINEEKGAKRWVVTQVVTRSGKFPKYPWISGIIENTIPLRDAILKRKIEEKLKKVKMKKVV